MAKSKSTKARRREVRRHIPRAPNTWVDLLRSGEFLWTTTCLGAFTLLAGLLAITAQNRPRFQLGQVAPEAIVTRVGFRAVDTQATQENRQKASQQRPAVYVLNTAYFRQIELDLLNLGQIGSDPVNQTLDTIAEDTRKHLQLEEKSFDALRKHMANESATPWEQLVDQLMQDVAGIAALGDKDAKLEREDWATGIVIDHTIQNEELFRPDTGLLGLPTDLPKLETRLKNLMTRFPDPQIQGLVMKILLQRPQPYYLPNKEETERRRKTAAEQVAQVEKIYDRDHVLIPSEKRIEELDLTLLKAEQEAYLASRTPMQRAFRRCGTIGLISLVGLGLWCYVAMFNPRVIRNPMRGLALTGLFILGLALAVALTPVQPTTTSLQPTLLYATVIFPTLLVTMILAIVYDQRFALAVGTAHALLVTLALRLPLGFSMILFTGVVVVGRQLDDIRTRSKLVQVGLWTGLCMAIVSMLFGMAQHRITVPWDATLVLWPALVLLGTGLVAGLLVQGFLPPIERIFKVTTSMTLKDLNDASHPLLRRLAQEAPGTNQHSLRIADMAEAAAQVIGANGLLCRVGAMYHDIGKINKPAYFIENQGGGPNRHSKLSPAMSLLIIVGHVKDGVEMAREYGIPPVLRQFIESHHGTTLVEYFYHAARKQKEAEAAPAPDEFEFRYPGPKPQTREAAILMICDGVEGAVRTLSEPTPIRIEQMVHNIANKRLMDGQFDECNLTLQELHAIEKSITKTMCVIFHSRIKYPEQIREEQQRQAAAEAAGVSNGSGGEKHEEPATAAS